MHRNLTNSETELASEWQLQSEASVWRELVQQASVRLQTVYVGGEAVLLLYCVCQEIHTQITTLVTQCKYAEKKCYVCIVCVRKFLLYSTQTS